MLYCTGIKVLLVNVNYIFFLSIILIKIIMHLCIGKECIGFYGEECSIPCPKTYCIQRNYCRCVTFVAFTVIVSGQFFKLDEFKSLLSQLRLREFRMKWKWRNGENTGKIYPCYMYNLCYGKLYCNTICCYARM